MAIKCKKESSDQLYYVSWQDEAIDWERATHDHGLTKDGYKEQATEEDARKLQPLEGEELTIFHAKMPTPRLINEAMQQPSGVAPAYFLSCRCLQSVDNLYNARGQRIELKHKGDGALQPYSENAIDATLHWEIGTFLLRVGTDISDPSPT